MKKFSEGSVVKLKGIPIKMTISCDLGEEALCVWFDENESFFSAIFNKKYLELHLN